MKCIVTLLLCLVSVSAAAANSDETIMVDGRARRYLVHDFATGSDLAPLVILLHGGGGSGQNMVEQTGFDAVAAREGLIAVYPYGSNGVFDNVLLTWNAAHCCAYAMRDNVDDVHFLSLLIDHLIATRMVDPGRVYVTGLSNGGMMTHRVGIELADRIAGIAPVIAGIFGDEPVRDYAMPVLIINGAEDRRVKAAGGELQGFGLGTSPADLPTLPIAAQGEYWARVNGCKSVVDSANASYDHRVYGDCRAGGRLESYVVKGNGHAWPCTFTRCLAHKAIAASTPPLAVPSNFVTAKAVISVARENCFACSNAFWPVEPSNTSNTSCGAFGMILSITRRILDNSFIKFTLLCKRPAVSIITTSAPCAFAEDSASNATEAGSAPIPCCIIGTPTRSDQMIN